MTAAIVKQRIIETGRADFRLGTKNGLRIGYAYCWDRNRWTGRCDRCDWKHEGASRAECAREFTIHFMTTHRKARGE